MEKNIKFTCDCGRTIYSNSEKQFEYNIKAHKKSKFHKEYERLKKFFKEKSR